MSIKYKLTRVNDNITHDPKPRYLVTTQSWGNIDTENIAGQLNKMSSFSPPDIDGLLSGLSLVLTRSLLMGHTVTLNGIGTFFITAHLVKELESPEYVPPGAVKVKRISFRPAPELRKALKDAKFTKVKGK